MAEPRHTLVLDGTVDQGRRIELARVAAQLEQEEMARVVEISVRSYQRTISGEREARRRELITWAELTGQDLSYFEGASAAEGTPIVSDHAVAVNRRPRAAA